MLTKRAKWILLIIGLVLGILCFVFGCVQYVNWSNNYNKSHPEVKIPLRTLSIQIDEDQREELFTQLRKYSKKHNLKFSLSLYSRETVNDRFFVVMYGKSFNISVASKPIDTTELDFHFTVDDPTKPPSQDTMDELLNDLKAFISEIPNVTIIEE